MKKNSLLHLIACSAAVTVLTGGNGFAQHYLNNGVRDSLTHKGKIALVHDESRDLNWYELENRVKALDSVATYTNPEKKENGSFRARLTIPEKVTLIMEENKHLMVHDIPRIRRMANQPHAVFHPDKDYVYGGFRDNLSSAEKRRLINEE